MLHTPDIPLDLGMCIAERLALSFLYHDPMVHVLPKLQGPACCCKGFTEATVKHMKDTIDAGLASLRSVSIPLAGV